MADGWCYVWGEGYRAPSASRPIEDTDVVDVPNPPRAENYVRPPRKRRRHIENPLKKKMVAAATVAKAKGVKRRKRDGRYMVAKALVDAIVDVVREHNPIRARETHTRLLRKGFQYTYPHVRNTMRDLAKAGVLVSTRLPPPNAWVGITVVYEMKQS